MKQSPWRSTHSSQPLGRQVDLHPKRFEHIGAAAARSDAAIAMLHHGDAAGREDEHDRRGNIEEIEPVSAGPADIDHRSRQFFRVDQRIDGAIDQLLNEAENLLRRFPPCGAARSGSPPSRSSVESERRSDMAKLMSPRLKSVPFRSLSISAFIGRDAALRRPPVAPPIHPPPDAAARRPYLPSRGATRDKSPAKFPMA